MACSVVVACVIRPFISCARLALLWLLALYGHSLVVHGLLCCGCFRYLIIYLLGKTCSVVVACAIQPFISFAWLALLWLLAL